MKVLITGIAGFAGSHLAEWCLRNPRVKVYGFDRPGVDTHNLRTIIKQIKIYTGDLRDEKVTHQVLKSVRPDWIFHLAAQPVPSISFTAPAETLTVNILNQVNIFTALLNLNLKPRVQIACSSEEYGLVSPREIPIKETCTLRPLSPYAVSKVTQDLLGFQYFQSYRIPVIRTRAFNHTGPRQSGIYVAANFARQIALIELGKQKPAIQVGNLAAIRDFTDVRDIVRAYWLSLVKGVPGEVYNICSGKGWSIRQVLDFLLSQSNCKIKILSDPTRFRSVDVACIIGNYTKFKNTTGWKPEIPFTRTLTDLLNYWRERIKS